MRTRHPRVFRQRRADLAWTRKVDGPVVQPPPSPLPPPSGPVAAPTPSPPADRSRWRSFRAFPALGQVGIWFGVAASALLGVGIVGAIAAGPKPAATLATGSLDTSESTTTTITTTTTTTMVTTAVATSTTTAATSPTIVVTTVPPATVLAAVPTTVVPVTDAIVHLTAQIVDGDTIDMSDGSIVRLIGIDTPERGHCGYDEASAVLAQLIVGQDVTLVAGARDNVDRYGRLLRYVEVHGVDVDLKMIESGRAIARYDGRDGYGVHPRQDAYVQADDLSPSINVCGVIAAAPATPTTNAPANAPTPAAVYYKNCTAVR
ncbi:MAG: micrococcal nuclease, partial [Ilumatobacteraceae bacterium]